MPLPIISLEYSKETDLDPLEELVWRALEVLQTYSLYDIDAYLFEPELNAPEQETILEVDSQDDDDSDIDDEDDTNDFGSKLTHLRTRNFEIDDDLSGVMENVVLIIDDNGVIQQMTEPGYVSLRIFDNDDIHTVMSDRTLDGISPRTTQFIFRLPWHDEGCAVFEGFTLNDEDRIDGDGSKEAIETLHDFFEDVVTILRHDLLHDAKNDEAEYMVQNIPTAAANLALMTILDSDSTD